MILFVGMLSTVSASVDTPKFISFEVCRLKQSCEMCIETGQSETCSGFSSGSGYYSRTKRDANFRESLHRFPVHRNDTWMLKLGCEKHLESCIFCGKNARREGLDDMWDDYAHIFAYRPQFSLDEDEYGSKYGSIRGQTLREVAYPIRWCCHVYHFSGERTKYFVGVICTQVNVDNDVTPEISDDEPGFARVGEMITKIKVYDSPSCKRWITCWQDDSEENPHGVAKKFSHETFERSGVVRRRLSSTERLQKRLSKLEEEA